VRKGKEQQTMSRLLVALIASAAAGAAFALNTAVFHDAPVTRLTAPELEAFKSFVEKTLDEAPDGKTVEWKAPTTRFVSKVTPHNSFTQGGNRCRETTVDSDSHDRQMRGRYLFCKVSTGAWEFALPEARRATGK
jgi:surface antigen